MQTLADLYRRNRRSFGHRDAFVFGQQRRSYAELHERSHKLASAIATSGIDRQEVVGVFATNSIEFFEICAACEISARISALFNFRSAAPELEYLVAHSGCRLLFFDARLANVVEDARNLGVEIETLVCIGENAPDWAIPFEDFLAGGRSDDTPDEPRPDDFATLFFTSGTTGRPKGVPWTHRAMLIAAQRSAMTEDPSTLQISPGFHVGGRVPPVAAMWNAGKTILDEGFDPERWFSLVESEQVNTTFMVPVMMQALLDFPDRTKFDTSSLKWVMAASTAIPPSLLTRAIEAFGSVFYVAYGSTECAGITRMKRTETNTETAENIARLSSVGMAETPVEMVLLDEQGHAVPEGEIGEVCVRSFCFSEYWHDPDATREAMFGEYFRTGDLGRLDERDFLFLVDRRKDMIITGGENVYSREVENALDRHDAVGAVAVIGVPDERWGEKVIAIIVRSGQHEVDEAELTEFSRSQLAKYKCPKQIIFVDELPLSGTGKIDKLVLRERYGGAV